MTAERCDNIEAKSAITAKLKEAIHRAGVACQAVADGPGILVDDFTSYIPDAVVNCGQPVSSEDRFAPSPIIVVEVLSSWTKGRDLGEKYIDYFRVPVIQHYLIVDLERRLLLHHRRGGPCTVVTTLVKEGALRLYPPGIEVQVDGIFASA
jgi:Uma2 family endonuclease